MKTTKKPLAQYASSHNDEEDSIEQSPLSKSGNPFMVFLNEYRQHLSERGFQNLAGNRIAQMAGENWRQMSAEDKASYISYAQKNKSLNDAMAGGRRTRRSRRQRNTRSPLRRTRRGRRSAGASMRRRVRARPRRA